MGAWVSWLQANNGAVIAIATVAGVLVAILYAIFTGGLWKETRRQAKITQRMFEASHRPYVSINPLWTTGDVDPRTARRGISIEFTLENHGGVPAVVSRWQVVVQHRNVTVAENDAGDFSLCIFPGGSEKVRPVKIAAEEAREIWNSPDPVSVDATVRYRGSYDRPYSTRVVAHLRPDVVVMERHEVN
jgi:hypothetical protein